MAESLFKSTMQAGQLTAKKQEDFKFGLLLQSDAVRKSDILEANKLQFLIK